MERSVGSSNCLGFEEIKLKNSHGEVDMIIEDSILYIQDVIVNETERGKGYGKQFIQKAIEIAKMKGCKEVLLDAVHWKMEKIVEKLGFEKDESDFGWRLQL